MCRSLRKLLAATLAIAAVYFPSGAAAAPGQLDASFGVGGVAFAGMGPSGGEAVASLALPDGRLLVAGNYLSGTSGSVIRRLAQMMVARFNVDGTPDATFGIGGRSPPTDYIVEGKAEAMALQADGKIVVAGYAGRQNQVAFAVTRFNADGTFDAAFGEKLFTMPGSLQSKAHAVALQADGRIVLAGEADVGGTPQMALLRLTASGALDTTFNATGRLMFPMGSGHASLRGLAIQPDGRILAVGEATGASSDFALVRLNADGTFDTSFGCATPGACTGRALFDVVGGSADAALATAILPDGRIVVAGRGGAAVDCAVARFNANGTNDTSFGFLGRITVPALAERPFAFEVAALYNFLF